MNKNVNSYIITKLDSLILNIKKIEGYINEDCRRIQDTIWDYHKGKITDLNILFKLYQELKSKYKNGGQLCQRKMC